MFDSGVGGLSVLAGVRELVPDERVLYRGRPGLGAVRRTEPRRGQGAQLRRGAAPRRPRRQGRSSWPATRRRRRRSTSCDAAMPDVPFIGMEPAVKPAAEQTKGGVIGVLATSATFQGELYASVVDRHAAGVEVVERVGRGLVELVEARSPRRSRRRGRRRRHLAPLVDAGVDTARPRLHPLLVPRRGHAAAPRRRGHGDRPGAGGGPAGGQGAGRAPTCGRRRATVAWCTSPAATRSGWRSRWSASSATRTPDIGRFEVL